jgi:hypothetical protein
MNNKIRDGKTFDRLYYQQNKERILKPSAEYYRKNKETIRKYRRERFYEAYKRYYRKHAERINATKRHNKEQKRLSNGTITRKWTRRKKVVLPSFSNDEVDFEIDFGL